MAVPKKKVSKSRRNQRRSHDAIKPVNVVVDKVTGEYKLPHHISVVDGTYNGRQVVEETSNVADENDAGSNS